MQLHITRDGQQFGPYDLPQVNEMLVQGSLLPTDYAWYEGAADWTPLAQVPGVTMPGAAPAPGEAIPVAAVASQPAAAEAQPSGDATTASASAAKKKKIFMIAGISVAGVGAIVGALFAFGVIGGGEEEGDTNGPKNNGGTGGKPSGNGGAPLPPPAANQGSRLHWQGLPALASDARTSQHGGATHRPSWRRRDFVPRNLPSVLALM
mgnify:CR=1 FL=1